ncbi:hypothetical protein FXO38_23311, partial [Capsicum annuum]
MTQYLHNGVLVVNFKVDLREAWLPSETTAALCSYREDELLHLRGTRIEKLEEWGRDYDYDIHNNFGDPGSSSLLARPVLGGYKEYPYPRRGRTERPLSKTDPKSVIRLPQIASFLSAIGDVTLNEFKNLEDVLQVYEQELLVIGDVTFNEFKNFENVLQVYEQEILALLPSETLAALCSYREDELLHLRGTGIEKLREWDRVYDYDVYNDFGDADSSPLLA